MCASVEPSESTTESLHFEFTIFQELLVDCGNLLFATRRWSDIGSHIHDLIGVEVKTYDGIVALWLGWLLLNAKAVAGV